MTNTFDRKPSLQTVINLCGVYHYERGFDKKTSKKINKRIDQAYSRYTRTIK